MNGLCTFKTEICHKNARFWQHMTLLMSNVYLANLSFFTVVLVWYYLFILNLSVMLYLYSSSKFTVTWYCAHRQWSVHAFYTNFKIAIYVNTFL